MEKIADILTYTRLPFNQKKAPFPLAPEEFENRMFWNIISRK